MMPVDLASPPRPPAPGSRLPAAVRPSAKRDNVGASLPARLGGGVDGWIALDGPARGGRGGGGGNACRTQPERPAAESQRRGAGRGPRPAWRRRTPRPWRSAAAAWPIRTRLRGLVPERLVFPDGFGVLTGMIRLDALGPRGRWTRLSVLGAPRRGGQPAASVEAATSSTVFRAYLTQVLPHELRRSGPDAVPAMGNPGPTRRPACANCSTTPAFPTADPGLGPTQPDRGCRPARRTST